MFNDRLFLFNERVDRLDRTTLAKRLGDPQYTLSYHRMMNREWISADGVSEDDVDAFVLNVRLLIQDRDGISIRKLAENVYSSPTVPGSLQQQFAQHRQRWCDHKTQPSMFRHLTEDRNFTNGELFDILMYGGLAHVDSTKVDHFYQLTKQGAFSSMVFASFLVSLRLFLQVVRSIRDTNLSLLEQNCH